MFDNHCEINILNRHVCASCRLTKCFTNGMQIELIRSSQSKKHKNNRTRKLLKKSIDIISTSLNRSNKNEQVFDMYCRYD
jgi:tmRNA-binding protein